MSLACRFGSIGPYPGFWCLLGYRVRAFAKNRAVLGGSPRGSSSRSRNRRRRRSSLNAGALGPILLVHKMHNAGYNKQRLPVSDMLCTQQSPSGKSTSAVSSGKFA